MILEEQKVSFNSITEFRKFIKESAEKKNFKVKYIVGTKPEISEETVNILIPIISTVLEEEELKTAGMTVLIPGTGIEEYFNVFMADYLDDDESLKLFMYVNMIKGLSKVYILNS